MQKISTLNLLFHVTTSAKTYTCMFRPYGAFVFCGVFLLPIFCPLRGKISISNKWKTWKIFLLSNHLIIKSSHYLIITSSHHQIISLSHLSPSHSLNPSSHHQIISLSNHHIVSSSNHLAFSPLAISFSQSKTTSISSCRESAGSVMGGIWKRYSKNTSFYPQ